MPKRIKHIGNLIVTEDNLKYASTVTEVSSSVYVRAENASFPLLAEVSGSVDVSAENASFPVLAKSGYVDVSGKVNIKYLVGSFNFRGTGLKLEYIDCSTMIIHGWKAHGDYQITKARYFGGGDLDALEQCYIAKQGDLTAHGDTLKEAITDLQFKIVGAEDREEVIARVKASQTVSIAEWCAISGACRSGTRSWLRDSEIDYTDQENLPLAEVLTITAGAYGGQKFAEAFRVAA